MPEEVRRALGDAGLFAMVAPAEVDATVSWHLANSGIAGLASLRLDSASRQELYARTIARMVSFMAYSLKVG